MAARKTKHQNDACREKIQTTQIINRMVKIGMGEVTADASQVSALKAILNKVLPDLKAIEHSGDADNPMQTVSKVNWCIVEPSK